MTETAITAVTSWRLSGFLDVAVSTEYPMGGYWRGVRST